jgi:hypothetical protein
MKLETRLEAALYLRGNPEIPGGNKWFVINYGPPASGKSMLKKNELILQLVSEFTDIDVDTIVSSLYAQMGGAYPSIPTQEMYFTLRKEADERSDEMLINSVVNGRNVLWETTGKDKAWVKYVVEFMKQNGYRVLLILPYVFYSIQVERCRRRQQAANCTEQYLADIREKSYKNFRGIAKVSDRVLVFDNNFKTFLIYDSLTSSSCADVENLVNDPNQTALHRYLLEKCR